MFVQYFCSFVSALLSILEWMFFFRCIFSWFDPTENNKIHIFLVNVTEPFVLPLRKLFDRKGWLRDTPIDAPFMLTYFILLFLTMLV